MAGQIELFFKIGLNRQTNRNLKYRYNKVTKAWLVSAANCISNCIKILTKLCKYYYGPI